MQAGALEYLITVNNKGVSSGLKQSEKDIKNFGNKLSAWTVAKGQLIAKYAEKAISTVYNISKQTVKGAVDAYGTFEQLEGGIKKLFGEKTQKAVIQNAKNAFRTAGLSANEYMQTVTAFSASLLNSLGGDTDKAAQIADMAIKDMSDNVNTFGTSMESVQNAYRGFAKGQFNMLDNLSLGYGGTRKEMERLLKDAGKIANKKFSIGNLSDIYEAINIIQDKKLKITGTTEKEAQDTIQGSIASAKAAWQNVLVEAGKGNWDFKYYVKSFTTVAKNVFKNIKPIATNAIKGLFTIGKELLPEIGGVLKDVFKTAKVSIAELLGLGDDATWGEIVSGIGQKLRAGAGKIKVGIAKFLDIENPEGTTWAGIAQKILDSIKNQFGEGGLLGELLSEGTAIIGEVINFAKEFIKGVVDWISQNQDAIKDLIVDIVTSLAGAVSELVGPLAEILSEVILSEKTWSAIMQVLGALGDALWNIIVEIGAAIVGLFNEEWGNEIRKLKKLGKQDEPKAGDTTPDGRTVIGSKTTSEGTAWLPWGKVDKKSTVTGYDGSVKIMPKDHVWLTAEGRKAWEEGHAKKNAGESGQEPVFVTAALKDAGYTIEETENLIQSLKELDPNILNQIFHNATYEESVDELNKALDLLKKVNGDWQANVKINIQPVGLASSAGVTQGILGLLGQAKPKAKGDWNIPYDNYPAMLHRGEMVLTKSQARRYKDGDSMDTGAIVSAIQGLRNDMTNLKLVVGRKTFGRAVADYGSSRVGDSIGGAESRLAAGYGT